VIPHTGRLHQIRASANAIGHHIIGDKLYGPDPALYDRFRTDALSTDDIATLRLKRQALHAAALSFKHPATGKRLFFKARLPADIACD
jgi:23S rRNA-/tRNA-specific pseudouridylate synthase